MALRTIYKSVFWGVFFFTCLIYCKKQDRVTLLDEDTPAGQGLVDHTWTFDKAHSNVNFEVSYMDYSKGMLTGRLNNFNFSPKFVFNEKNLNQCVISAWVQLSSFDSGEPARDGPGKCARSYLGVTYLDKNKTIVDPLSDTAWFKSSKVVKSGTGYVAIGTFSFNRWRAPGGYPDGTNILRPCTLYFHFNGIKDFDMNGDNIGDRYYASFTGYFSFRRSDHMDTQSVVQWVPVPNPVDSFNNVHLAYKNKTYGVWTSTVADKVKLTIHLQFFKNH